MTESSHDSLFRELDTFELQIPGGQTAPFHDNQTLLRMLRYQYPNWEKGGTVTSVPIARVPRLFLHNTQMSKKLQKDFNLLQKGEVGEIKVYRLLLDAADPNQKGMMVFPNVNAREIFKTESAHLEIDTVVAHPTKGFFVFNIKSQGGKGLTPQQIQGDIVRHNGFINMLIQYGHSSPVVSIPIHAVICLLHDDKKQKFDSLTNSGNVQNSTIIFSKNELTPESFAQIWQQKLAELPNLYNLDVFEVAVARLVTLNSLGSSAALIHNQMSSNYMQAIKKSKNQFKELPADLETKKSLENNSRAQSKTNSNSRNGFIIWTEEQLKIICTVVEHLQNPAEKGYLRLVVTGCKGSGKTMLLVFLAKFAQEFFSNYQKNSESKVLVFNGHFQLSSVLTKWLKQLVEPSNVSVFDATGKIPLIHFGTKIEGSDRFLSAFIWSF